MAEPRVQPDVAIRGFNLACSGGATPVNLHSLDLVSRFETYLAAVESARLVRWPFRMLAAALVAAGCFALIGIAHRAFALHESRSALLALASYRSLH